MPKKLIWTPKVAGSHFPNSSSLLSSQAEQISAEVNSSVFYVQVCVAAAAAEQEYFQMSHPYSVATVHNRNFYSLPTVSWAAWMCVCVCLPAGWPPHCAADSPVWWGSGVCRWFWWQRLGWTSCAYLRGIKPQSESQTHSAVPECNQSNKLKNLNVRIGFHGFKHCKCNILQYSRFLERWLGKLWHLKNVSKVYLTLCPPGSPFNGSFSLPT